MIAWKNLRKPQGIDAEAVQYMMSPEAREMAAQADLCAMLIHTTPDAPGVVLIQDMEVAG